jgi:hypothetical protein
MSRFGGANHEKCTKCGKTVYIAEMAKMENQIWHIECLRCVECNKKLSGANWGGFVPPDNSPYCSACHRKLRQAAGNAIDFSGSTTSSKWNSKSGEAASPSESTLSVKPGEGCTKCGKRVYPAETVKMEGQLWHDNCLRCVEEGCNKKLNGSNWGGFVPPDNKPYCNTHHKRLIQASGSAIDISGSAGKWNQKATGESTSTTTPAAEGASPKPRWGGAPSQKCEKCAKTVYNAEMVKMEGLIFHDTCLRCVEEGCNKKLTGANWGGFVPPDNRAYCKVHHGRLIAASGSAVGISGSTTASKWNINTTQ